MSLFELTYLSVSGNDAIGNGRRGHKKKIQHLLVSHFLFLLSTFIAQVELTQVIPHWHLGNSECWSPLRTMDLCYL